MHGPDLWVSLTLQIKVMPPGVPSVVGTKPALVQSLLIWPFRIDPPLETTDRTLDPDIISRRRFPDCVASPFLSKFWHLHLAA